jgi:hypothetical protein
MADYDKTIGRVRVEFITTEPRDQVARISCVDGQNDISPILTLTLEEVRDLRHLLDRMIATAMGGR